MPLVLRIMIAALAVAALGVSADHNHQQQRDHHHNSRELEAASAKVDAFETELYLSQTRTRHRSGAMLGPKRKSLHSRAQAIARSESVVEKHNRAAREGKATYTMALNDLSDLSDKEYRSFLKSRPDAVGARNSPPNKHQHGQHQHHLHGAPHVKRVSVTISSENATAEAAAMVSAIANVTIPKELNWLAVEGGKYVTPIKNQGTCGSCWAFSGVAVVESRYAIENKVTASPLSIEQVLSCSAPLDHIRSKFAKDMISSSQGCDGGMPFLTFEYLSRVSPYGIACADKYPYVMATHAGETQCVPPSMNDVAVAWNNASSSYVAVASSDEDALLRAVLSGPVSANLDATGDGFKLYAGGIYDAKDCASDGKEVNHAVVIAGFGETASGAKYWIVRNTWGTMWGESGNMRIARGAGVSKNGPCNLYLYSSYPVNLATGKSVTPSATSGGATCPVPASAFVALPAAQMIGFGWRQCLWLLGTTVLAVGSGMTLYYVSERRLNIQQSAGGAKYRDSYKRWVLPSREQLLANLASRQTAQV